FTLGLVLTETAYLPSFAQKSALRISAETAGYLATGYSAAMAVSRAICIPVSIYIRPEIMILFGLILTVIAEILLLILADRSLIAMWTGNIIYGLGVGPFYGSSYYLIERITPITKSVVIARSATTSSVTMSSRVEALLEELETIEERRRDRRTDHWTAEEDRRFVACIKTQFRHKEYLREDITDEIDWELVVDRMKRSVANCRRHYCKYIRIKLINEQNARVLDGATVPRSDSNTYKSMIEWLYRYKTTDEIVLSDDEL
ncbi:unnamed protein product, partial [Medioppia subpectinata]